MSQNKSKPKKIVFCGLDNGGKTSILMFLNRQFSLISKVKPTTKRQVTKGAVSVLGLDLNIWDLGGQQAYREEHLGNKQRYFSKVSSLFYVIDVQDANRFEESIQFFLEVVNGAKEINPNLSSVYVFFHKYDPDIKKDDGLETDIEDLEQKITSLPLDVEIRFYKSSVYDGTNLLRAFYDGVIKDSEKSKLLFKLLKEYTTETFASAAMLLDQSYTFLASRTTHYTYLLFCQSTVPYMSRTMDGLREWGVETEEVSLNIDFFDKKSETQKKGKIFLKEVPINSQKDEEEKIFLLSLSLNPKTEQKVRKFMPKLAHRVQNIVRN